MRTVMLWRRRTTTLTFLQISVHEAVQRPMLCTCGHEHMLCKCCVIDGGAEAV